MGLDTRPRCCGLRFDSKKEPTTMMTQPATGLSVETAPWINPEARDRARHAAQKRQISGRRRHVDPTTCERDYSAEELEFMQAMQAYKARSGRMFPTWSEVLEVVRELGYAQGGAGVGR